MRYICFNVLIALFTSVNALPVHPSRADEEMIVKNVLLSSRDDVAESLMMRVYDICSAPISEFLQKYDIYIPTTVSSIDARTFYGLMQLYDSRASIPTGTRQELEDCITGRQCKWVRNTLLHICPLYGEKEANELVRAIDRHHMLKLASACGAALLIGVHSERSLLSLDDLDSISSDNDDYSMSKVDGVGPMLSNLKTNAMNFIQRLATNEKIRKAFQPLVDGTLFKQRRRTTEISSNDAFDTIVDRYLPDVSAERKPTLSEALDSVRSYVKRIGFKIYTMLPMDVQLLLIGGMKDIRTLATAIAKVNQGATMAKISRLLRPSEADKHALLAFASMAIHDDSTAIELILNVIPETATTTEQRSMLRIALHDLPPVTRTAATALAYI